MMRDRPAELIQKEVQLADRRSDTSVWEFLSVKVKRVNTTDRGSGRIFKYSCWRLIRTSQQAGNYSLFSS